MVEGGGQPRDKKEKQVLGAQNESGKWWNQSVSEALVSPFAGDKYKVTFGHVSEPPKIAEWLPQFMAPTPKVDESSIEVFSVRAKDQEGAVKNAQNPLTRKKVDPKKEG